MKSEIIAKEKGEGEIFFKAMVQEQRSSDNPCATIKGCKSWMFLCFTNSSVIKLHTLCKYLKRKENLTKSGMYCEEDEPQINSELKQDLNQIYLRVMSVNRGKVYSPREKATV